ncbi:MAG: DUF2834 domain-containing protein [Alphaproteobacteria bacterium]|nr:DUF2834 domain-containing protein [Alphaproteobacteria bacterium]HPF45832.1 DUF2834 domain-containing protein [Emcibacteraceae bacterium]HRW31088.1 DUF2834 domain-containing protein [Emcibacteraceae bacterium]
MKNIYLILAIVGGIIPFIFLGQFFEQEGFKIPNFIRALFSNGASAGFTTDLVISSLVFWIYIFQARQKSDGPSPYLFIVLNLTVGLSCALPAYLYAREKAGDNR